MDEMVKASAHHTAAVAIMLFILLAVLLFSTGFAISHKNHSIFSTTYSISSTTIATHYTGNTISSNTIASNSTSTVPQNDTFNVSNANVSKYVNYTLNLINSERKQFNLTPVTLDTEPSAEQHSESMLDNGYFSHWDIYGMKPYMRYTLLGGRGSMDENVAYRATIYSCPAGSTCNVPPINVTSAINYMENSMIYNDSLCCDNGHRMNILNPNHNKVSIGVAYNKTTVYLTEDFIDHYINWLQDTPNVYNQNVSLYGDLSPGYRYQGTEIIYDPIPQNMTLAELNQTSSYSYGTPVGGVANGTYYYPGLITLYASTYRLSKTSFEINFSISNLYQKYGSGVYTVGVFLTNSSGGSFLGGSYSIFLNQNGKPYTPKNI